jgi:hypothetical protein
MKLLVKLQEKSANSMNNTKTLIHDKALPEYLRGAKVYLQEPDGDSYWVKPVLVPKDHCSRWADGSWLVHKSFILGLPDDNEKKQFREQVHYLTMQLAKIYLATTREDCDKDLIDQMMQKASELNLSMVERYIEWAQRED